MHDLSELEAVVRRVKRRHHRLVVGGALMGALPEGWQGLPEIDVVAVGYGEYLAPAVSQWMRSVTQLPPPAWRKAGAAGALHIPIQRIAGQSAASTNCLHPIGARLHKRRHRRWK